MHAISILVDVVHSHVSQFFRVQLILGCDLHSSKYGSYNADMLHDRNAEMPCKAGKFLRYYILAQI